MPAFGAAAYVPSISLERNLFVRERADGLYTALTYLAYKMCDEMAINAVARCACRQRIARAVCMQGGCQQTPRPRARAPVHTHVCVCACVRVPRSVVVTAIGFYGIQLQGSYALFLLVYYAVLAVGVGECAQRLAGVPGLVAGSVAAPARVCVCVCVCGCVWVWEGGSIACGPRAARARDHRRCGAAITQCWRTLWPPSHQPWTSPTPVSSPAARGGQRSAAAGGSGGASACTPAACCHASLPPAASPMVSCALAPAAVQCCRSTCPACCTSP
jgi:hypothetical protein